MHHCAAEQVYDKEAAETHADSLHEKLNDARQLQENGDLDAANKIYSKVINFLQSAAKAGNFEAVGRGLEGFSNGDEMRWSESEEELTRFYMILIRLKDSNDQQPVTVDEIDKILRLPSSKLPPLESIMMHREDTPPPLPSEERITEMAHEKNLDPETGLPLEVGGTKSK